MNCLLYGLEIVLRDSRDLEFNHLMLRHINWQQIGTMIKVSWQ